jgi:hypothetical protein
MKRFRLQPPDDSRSAKRSSTVSGPMIPDSNSTQQGQDWGSRVFTDATETALLGVWDVFQPDDSTQFGLTSNLFQTSASTDPNMYRDPVTYTTDGGQSYNTPLSMQSAEPPQSLERFHTGSLTAPFQVMPFQNDYHGPETGFDTGAWATSVPLTSGQGLPQCYSRRANLAATMEPIMTTSSSQVRSLGVHDAAPAVIPSERYIAQWDPSPFEAYPRQANDHLAYLSYQNTPSSFSLAHFTLPESRERMTYATSGAGVQSLNIQQQEYSATSPATSKTDRSLRSSAAASKATEKGEQESIRVVKLEEATSQNRPKKLVGWVRIESEKDGTVYVKLGWPPSKPRGDPVGKYKGVQSYLQRLGRYHQGMSKLLGQEDTLVKQLIHLASLLNDPTSKLHLLLSSGVLTELSVKLSVLLERCLDYEEPRNPTCLRGNWKIGRDRPQRMHLLKERLRTIDLAFQLTTRWEVYGIIMLRATWPGSNDD